MGGEEFVILLPHASLEAALTAAERIRQRLLTLTEATRITVSASFGVAAFIADDTLEDLLSRADAGLYRAKRAGRDRVVAAEVSDPTVSHRIGRDHAA